MRRSVFERISLFVLDTSIASVAAIFIYTAIGLYNHMHPYPDELGEISQFLYEHDAVRVALPIGLRADLDLFSDRTLKPVLYNPETSSIQMLALLDTPWAVIQKIDKDMLRKVSAVAFDSYDFGELTLLHCDLRKARGTPLESGEKVRFEFSRPYRYAPLAPSFVVQPGNPLSIPFTLNTGRYIFEVEVFSLQRRVRGVFVVKIDGNPPIIETLPVNRIVRGPTSIDFEVPEDLAPRLASIEIHVDPKNEFELLVHGLELRKL